jgi:glycosyltransferase involved in cell wall biosynthesis
MSDASSSQPVVALALEEDVALRGGVNLIVETLIEGLAPSFRIVLLSTDRNVDEIPAPIRRLLHGHVRWPFPNASSREVREVVADLVKLEVQLVHFHSGTFGFGMRRMGRCPIRRLAKVGIRSIWSNHTFLTMLDGYCGPEKPRWFKLALLPFAWISRVWELLAVSAVVTDSMRDAEMERRCYWPVAEKFRCIYHSRLDEDAPPVVKERSRSTITSVGHIARRKGQHFLARAFAMIADRNPEWRLVIVGPPVEADCLAEIEEVVRNAKLDRRVEITGGRTDTEEFLRRAEIFVQPSLFEGLPLALQEALFYGCACIATQCQGNVELVAHEKNGLLVAPGQIEELAAALERLMRDPVLRARLCESGRQFVVENGMTKKRMVQGHLDLYLRALQQTP